MALGIADKIGDGTGGDVRKLGASVLGCVAHMHDHFGTLE